MTVVTIPSRIGDVPVTSMGAYPPVGPTLEGQALAIARKYSASVYIPGVSNFSDTAGTTASVNDGAVARVNDGKTVDPFPATQSTSGFRPLLIGGPRNLLLQSGLTGGTSGTEGSGAVAPTSWIFPANTGAVTFSVGTIRFQATAQRPMVGQALATVSGSTYALSCYVEANTSSSTLVNMFGHAAGAGGAFGADTWSINGNSATSTSVPVAGDRISVSWTQTTGAADSQMRIGLGATGNVTGDVTLSRPQLELGSTASAYVPTTTAAASQGSRPKAWIFDGTDDRLSLSGPVFQMSDDHFVVACIQSSNVAVESRIYFQRSSANAQIGITVGTTGNLVAQWSDDSGAAANIAVGTNTIQSGVSAVVAITKAGNVKKVFKNGVQLGTNSIVLGTATFSASSAAIGFDPQSLSRFFNGPIYGVIAGKGAITDAELLVIETYLGSLGGLNI